jgi:hypothetical protein
MKRLLNSKTENRQNDLVSNKKNVIAEWLLRIFYIIFFGFVSYIMLANACIAYYVHSLKSNYNVISIAIVSLSFLAIALISISTENSSKLKEYYIIPILLFICALTIRLLIIQMIGFNTNQTSDFGLAYVQSQKQNPLDILYYKVFSNWGMYVLYLKLIQQIFGNYQIVGIIGNAILSAFSVVLIYFILLITTKKIPMAIIAALIFNFWPAHLFYTVLLSPDFLTIFLFLSTLLFLSIGHNYFNLHRWEKGIIYYILSGIAAGFGNFLNLLSAFLL